MRREGRISRIHGLESERMALEESAKHSVNWIELALGRVQWQILKDLEE
jgi:hypothetical protein